MSCTKLKNVPIYNSKLLNFYCVSIRTIFSRGWSILKSSFYTRKTLRAIFGYDLRALLNILLETILSKLSNGRVKFLTNDTEDFLLLMISGEKTLWRISKQNLDILGENSRQFFFSLRFHEKKLIKALPKTLAYMITYWMILYHREIIFIKHPGTVI